MPDRALAPIPETPDSAEFLAGAREGRLLIRRCTACRKTHWYPRPVCPFCFGNTEWEAASGEGVIYSFSLPRKPVPYAMAYVTLAEGPTMLTNIVGCDIDALRIGLGVRVAFTAEGVPAFTPATPDGGPPAT